jgi:hypothetical protein
MAFIHALRRTQGIGDLQASFRTLHTPPCGSKFADFLISGDFRLHGTTRDGLEHYV